MIRISESLIHLGFEVLLVGRILNTSKQLSQQIFKQERLKCLFNKGFIFYLEFNIRIFLFLMFNKTDIVIANDLDTIIGTYYGSKVNKSKRIFDAHEIFTEVPELRNRKFKKNIWKWIEKKYVPLYNLHYTVNDSLAQYFKKLLNIEFKVIKNVPYKSTVKKIYKKESFIIYQGALNKGRGLSELIVAMKNIDLNLKIAGSGDLENQLKQQVTELKLNHKIEFLGKLKPDALKSISQKATIGINLLENNSLNYYYSLANKFFDYIQAEIPQICMSFPEYKDINKKYEVAILVKNLDKQTLTKAVKQIQEINKYKLLQKNCKIAKNYYCWENEVDELNKIFSLYI